MDLSWVLAVVGGLVAAWLLFLVVLWVLRPRDIRLGDLVRVVPDLLRLVRQLLADRTVPLSARVALIFLLVWLLSPIDLVPDLIPILGPLDDVVVAILVLRFVRRMVGIEGLRERWTGTPEGFDLLRAVTG